MPVAGFVTREIREEGARMEFELERLAVPALAAADDTIVVVDELGKRSSPPSASVTPSPAC
jgi:nucleoside-triphosphatase THEP1